MLPTSQAEQLVDAVDHAEVQASWAGRAISDTAADLDAVVRQLSGGRAAAGAGAIADIAGWAGHAGEQARLRVGDVWGAVSVLSGHCLFLADVLRVEGSWLARALLAGGSEVEVVDADQLLAVRLSEAADALAGFADGAAGAATDNSTDISTEISAVPCLDLAASTDGDPRAVAQLWHSLDPAQRQRLARDHPELGSVAGLSSATRDALNRTRLSRLLDAVGDPGQSGPEHGGTSVSGQGRGALTRQGLLALADHLEADPSRLLLELHVDGSGEEGPRAVVASADPDGADRVVTLIPGTGSSLESLDRTSSRADALCSAADGDVATESCVAVSWQGYDAPPDVASAGTSTDRAVEYADDLRTYTAGLDAVEALDGHNAPHAAVGYSYGSTALGAAASDPRGLAVDRMIHVGSPGAAVESIDEQWIDNSGYARPAKDHEVVGVTSRWDPVPWWSITGVLGGRPGTEAFGGIAVAVTEPGDGPSSIRDTHSRYFDPGAVSLNEIGKILFPR